MKISKVETEKGKAKIVTEEKPWVKPDYQQVVDDINRQRGSNPPSMENLCDLLVLIAQDVHEIKVRQKKGV